MGHTTTRRLRVALAVLATLAVLGPVASGCTDDSEPEVPASRGVVAGTDTDTRSVELDEVFFDASGDEGEDLVSLAEIDDAAVRAHREAIPALTAPPYDPLEGGDWLDDDDLVLVYRSRAGMAFAYPHKIMNFHEIVNDTLDGEPVVVSYSPLSGSGAVYDRRVEDQLLSFANSGSVYQSGTVMLDAQTRTYWWQAAGRGIVGDLTGSELEPLPGHTLRWADFREAYPDGRVLSRDTGFGRAYTSDPFLEPDSLDRDYQARVDDGQVPFPVSDEVLDDDQLSPGTRVAVVGDGPNATAFAPALFPGRAVDATVAGRRVVVIADAQGRGAAAYFRDLGGRSLDFELTGGTVPGVRDRQTGSTWDLAGRAVAGPLEGEKLEPVPVRTMFWFAFVAAFPAGSFHEVPEEVSETTSTGG